MDATIFDRLMLSPEADAVRRASSARARQHLATALAEFSSVSDRPIHELADRLLRGYGDLMTKGYETRLLKLIVDVIGDDVTTTTTTN